MAFSVRKSLDRGKSQGEVFGVGRDAALPYFIRRRHCMTTSSRRVHEADAIIWPAKRWVCEWNESECRRHGSLPHSGHKSCTSRCQGCRPYGAHNS